MDDSTQFKTYFQRCVFYYMDLFYTCAAILYSSISSGFPYSVFAILFDWHVPGDRIFSYAFGVEACFDKYHCNFADS